jgi:uncharacterized protein (DUF58 family)
MRDAFSGLTTRGQSFIAAGLACMVCAFVLEKPDLLAVGLFLVVLSVGAALAVGRSRYRLGCTRIVDPARLEAGRPGRVVLRLQNVSRLPTGLLLVEDTLPYTLGARPRFILQRVEGNGLRDVSYAVRSDVRGRYRIGPLTVRIADPLGLCEVTRAFRATDTLTVTPQVWTLPPTPVGAAFSGAHEGSARSIAAHGEDDVATREYRDGDDLRRIHWRSTAHRGEMMVRREEAPWRAGAVVFLDNRDHVHHGDGPGSSFEYACSAVASVGMQLMRAGFSVRLGPGVRSASGVQQDTTSMELLDALAVATPERRARLLAGPAALDRDGMVVAVLGEISVDDASELVRSAPSSRGNIAVLLESTTWRAASPAERAEASARTTAAAGVLQAGGWRVLVIAHGTALASIWPYINVSGSRAAPLASMPGVGGRAVAQPGGSPEPIMRTGS